MNTRIASVCVMSCLVFFFPVHLFGLESTWTRALAGKAVAGPSVYENRVFVAGSDRSVTCLSAQGNFLWSKNLSGKVLPLMTITSAGQVYIVTGTGTINAFNADGSLLWQVPGTTIPLFEPYEGRDGRFFIVYPTYIRCFSSSGSIKWILPLENIPVKQLSETGDGDLVLSCADSRILRISPFGALLEKTSLPAPPTAFYPISGGYVVGYSSGLIQAYDVRKNTELVWQFQGRSSCINFASAQNTLLTVHADGSLFGLNPTDGSLLWKNSAGRSIPDKIFLSYDYGQFNISFAGFAGAWSVSGMRSWQTDIPLASGIPAISETGNIYTTDDNWVLYCYRPETRIIIEKKIPKLKNYGILNGKSLEYGMPYSSDPLQIRDFFDTVSENIKRGTVGTQEVAFARRLTEIIQNDSGEYFSGRSFDGSERGRAAILLGQIGSSEYREVLINQAYGEFDSSLAIGILYGIAAIGNDRDGKFLEAIRHLVKVAGTAHTGVIRAACDALNSVIKYSAGKTAIQGTEMLISFLDSPYDENTKYYARQIMRNILQ